MREPLAERPVLVAGEVKARLLDALAPLWGATLAGLADQPELADPGELLFAITLNPPLARVFREAKEGRPAVALVAARMDALPDEGAALVDAVTAYVAGTLAELGDEAGEHALRYAERVETRGGFLLLVRPLTGNTRLFLAKAGEDLSAALDLGGIVEPVTWN